MEKREHKINHAEAKGEVIVADNGMFFDEDKIYIFLLAGKVEVKGRVINGEGNMVLVENAKIEEYYSSPTVQVNLANVLYVFKSKEN